MASDSTTWLGMSRNRRRSAVATTPTTSPKPIPPMTSTPSCSSTPPVVSFAPTAPTATAKSVSATPSLMRPSVSSTVTSLRGAPSRCSTVPAATGSGGATAAPNASAAAHPRSGTITSSTPATAAAVATTSPTACPSTATRFLSDSRGSLKNAA